MYLRGSMKINDKGNLEVGGIEAGDLARQFGTPLYVLDEAGLRENCRDFRDAFASYGDTLVIYASKTLSCLSVYRIIEEEGLGLDIVSGGELYTALKAGFNMEKVYFHGNNKSRDEMVLAVKSGLGRIVVDNLYELDLLEEVCAELNKTQSIMLRITPGVEAHTHEFIKTGQLDSKFGFTLSNGQAMAAIKAALEKKHLHVKGLHCHIGSQIFEMSSYSNTAEIMMNVLAEVKERFHIEFEELNVGGGFGIFYAAGDDPKDPRAWAQAVMDTVKEKARELNLRQPKIIVEPGRAVSGPAGLTLYTVGSIKEIPGIRKYVAVDGGMTDNLRPALYNAKYTAVLADNAVREKTEIVSIAGKCCESGDMLIWDIVLPVLESGDLIAVFATGAYNYSMASNYNKLPRPAMVLVNEGAADVIIERETYDDLIRNEILLERLASK